MNRSSRGARGHVWGVDGVASALFDAITRLPEYYLTRREREILAARAADVAALTRADTLVELGSGTSEKTRLLLDALAQEGRLRLFVPLDVDEQTLRRSAAALLEEYRGVEVHAVVADFEGGLSLLPGVERGLLAFLGSTIGNLPPDRRRAFLLDAATSLRAGAWFLLGFDLVKDPARLVRAYDDAARVTQELPQPLRVLNRELDADFVDSRFEHVARWDADNEWMEMALRSRDEQRVRVRELDLEVELAAGEEIRTEISAKFRPDGVAAELEGAGFAAERFWFDRRRDFGLCLAQRT